jgi:LuxR family maltose regulon positive regulatory protein
LATHSNRSETTPRPDRRVLVQSRLRPPVLRTESVRRTELLRRLDQGVERPVTVVCAPPGFGKTTLLAQWVAELGEGTPVAWVTLAEDANDPATFLAYVIESLRTVDPSVGRQARRRLGALDNDPPSATILPSLLNDLAAVPGPVVLVLDDFHMVQEPESRRWLRFLMANLDGPLRLVVASRTDPLLRLGRIRAQGELTELGAGDLRFSRAEAKSLLVSQGVRLADDELLALLDSTEGWPVGVYLAGMYLGGAPGRHASQFHGTHRHVVEFMRDEVLNQQPEMVRRFLLTTSILDRFSPTLCDAVWEGEGAGLLLADLERSNMFVVGLDDDGAWYRYHHLFRDVLRSELERTGSEEIPGLHLRAAHWHRRHGNALEAVEHALAAGDDALTVELIKAYWVVLGRSGHRALVWSWIQGLPWDVVASDPHLCAIAGFLLVFGGQFEQAAIWLARVIDEPGPPGPLPDGFGSVASIRATAEAHPASDVGASTRAARRALELEPEGSAWHSSSEVALGLNLYLAGRPAEARPHLERARVEAATAPRPGVELLALTFLSLIEREAGDQAEADALAGEARAKAERYDIVDYPALAPMYMVTASALDRDGDRDGAIHDLEEGLRLASLWGHTAIPALTALLGARLRRSWGDLAGARALLRDAWTCVNACPDPGALRDQVAALEARLRSRVPRQRLSEELTTGEIAVLRLLATDLSLSDIAARLFVSINTIKTHTRHIYQKLQVPSRAQAVERARADELI